MTRNNLPVSKDVVRLVFALRRDDHWSLSKIGLHFNKTKQWAAYVLSSYSAESLSPKVVQKFGRKRKTDEVEDGVIVGLSKYMWKVSYGKLTSVLNDENICPEIKPNLSSWIVFQRCKEAGTRAVRPVGDELTAEHKRIRVEWAQKLLTVLASDPHFIKKVLFSDEVCFDLSPGRLKVTLLCHYSVLCLISNG